MKQEQVTEQFCLKQLKVTRTEQTINVMGGRGGGDDSYLFTTILITIY